MNTGRLCYEIPDLYLGHQKEETEAVQVTQSVAEVDPGVYARYEGTYRMGDGTTFLVSTSENRLFLQQVGTRPIEMHPKSATEYFLKGINLEMSFSPDSP